MSDASQQHVLGQKATAARRAFEARGMSPAKALRRALSRTADVNWDLALVTHAVSQEILDQDGVVDWLGEGRLLVLLDGPDGAMGLAVFDREVMTGLIEVQTILQVTQIPVEDRPLTATDAAMMAPLIDGTLERFAGYLDDHPLRPQLDGFRFGAMVEDARTAGLLLDASSYRGFRVSIDLALGRRKGELLIILPERDLTGTQVSNAGEDAAPGPYETMMKRVPARLQVVLTKITLPLGEAADLQPGALIPLPPDVLDQAQLIAADDKVVALGRLGQMNGHRAVRLTWPARPGDAAALPVQAHDDPVTEIAEAPGMDVMPEPLAPTPEEPAFDPGAESEELPDLPPLEFEASGDFDFDLGDAAEGGGDDADLGDFAGAPMEMDFDTT